MQATTTNHGKATGLVLRILRDIDPGRSKPGYRIGNGCIADVESAHGCTIAGGSKLPTPPGNDA